MDQVDGRLRSSTRGMLLADFGRIKVNSKIGAHDAAVLADTWLQRTTCKRCVLGLRLWQGVDIARDSPDKR